MSAPSDGEGLARSEAGGERNVRIGQPGVWAGRGARGEQVWYVHPGHLHAAAGPCTITMILGSCVSVCLYDPVRRVGGANHFLLPTPTGREIASTRFGDTAMRQLLARVIALGAMRSDLEARVFGGACVLDVAPRARGTGLDQLGQRNVELARRILRYEAIPIRHEDVGGRRGRKLTFRIEDGSTHVTLL